MANGYMGKLLEVDLSTGKIQKLDLDMKIAEKFVGGRGLGAKLLLDRIKDPGLDPLSPENPLMFLTGPMTGTPFPGPSRLTICGKSSITSPVNSAYPNASTLAWSCVGGMIAPEIKFAGYDGIIVTGKSEKPVYLLIDNDKVEIKDAKHLWGKTTNETDLQLRDELGPTFRTLYIGPAGENLVRYAAMITESTRAAARSGLACVMGSKKLKALAVRGNNVVPTAADYEKTIAMREELFKLIENWSAYEQWRRWGTTAMLLASTQSGTQATKNFQEGTYVDAPFLDTPISEQQFWVRHRACFQCPIRCMKVGIVNSGPYKGTIAEGPEYETGTMHGSNCMVTDQSGMMKSIELSDNLGLDNISMGNVLGFVMDCYENGILTKKDLNGIEMKWGNVDGMLKLQRMVCERKGIGDILAHGVKKAAEKIGKGSDYLAMHVKGQEIAAWNIPANHGFAIVYGTSTRGACHQVGPDIAEQHRRCMCDTLVMCRFVYYGIGAGPFLKSLNTVTGWNWTEEQFFKVAERIWNIEKVFNAREGFRRIDDYVPKRFTEKAFTVGPKAGAILPKEKQEQILDDYYTKRGWDVKTSIPTEAKLKDLGLDECIPVIKTLS